MAKKNDMGDFTFNTKPFTNGLKNISKAMLFLPKQANNMSLGVSKGMMNVVGKIGLIVLAFKAAKGIMNKMPEIGEVFGTAKDIFFKNLLYPLRKMVFPYLQRLLDWVRDNRTLFVKWGQVVANVFGIVVNVVKNAINIVKTLISSFKGFFEALFGKPIKSIEETFNMLTFKLAVISTFIMAIISKVVKKLEPSFTLIGEIISEVVKAWVGFMEGFIKGFKDIDKQYGILNKLNEAFGSFLNLVKELSPLLEPLGELIGRVFGVVLVATFETLKGVLNTIVDLIKLIKGEMDVMDVLKNDIIVSKIAEMDIGKKLGDFFKNDVIISKIIEMRNKNKGKETEVKDAIIRPNGDVIRTDPNDTLFATKNGLNFGEGKRGVTITRLNIDFSGMSIILQNGSKEEAQNVAINIVETIRNRLAYEFETQGL